MFKNNMLSNGEIDSSFVLFLFIQLVSEAKISNLPKFPLAEPGAFEDCVCEQIFSSCLSEFLFP